MLFSNLCRGIQSCLICALPTLSNLGSWQWSSSCLSFQCLCKLLRFTHAHLRGELRSSYTTLGGCFLSLSPSIIPSLPCGTLELLFFILWPEVCTFLFLHLLGTPHICACDSRDKTTEGKKPDNYRDLSYPIGTMVLWMD